MKSESRLSICLSLCFMAALFAFGASDAEKNHSTEMNAVACGDVTSEGDVKVLFIGNSITLHGVAPAIGWTNHWGMAASAQEKDYVHLVAAGIARATGRKPQLCVRNLYTFEHGFADYDFSALDDLVAFGPEFLVVALGENVRDLKTEEERLAFESAFGKLLGRLAAADVKPRIVVRGVFWPNEWKDACMKRAAERHSIPFVKADFGSADEMKAIGLFAHPGVANHPGDRGMAAIADVVLKALFPEGARVARTIRPEGTGFSIAPGRQEYRPLSDDYRVFIDGREAEVRACRESRVPFNRTWPGRQRPLDQSERASYLALEAAGPVAMRVVPKSPVRKAVVRPLSRGIVPEAGKDGISFTCPGPGYYVLETRGAEKALHIFIEPPRDFSGRRGATYCFGPGMHMVGWVRLKSHDRVYVDRDAIVFGCFTGENVEDVKIFGHGVIDGRVCERVFEGCYTPLQPSCVRFHGSRKIEIDGPILMDSPNWALAFFGCEDVSVSHVKVVGQWRYNTDGIDICNSRRVTVGDSFVRSFDDTIAVKGVLPYRDLPVEDVTVERCVLWCGWGKTIEPGVETWASAFRRVRFSDCDIVRSSSSALNISAGGSAVMEDFLFEDIRVEMQTDNLPEVLQESDGQRYDPRVRKSFPMLVKVDNTRYGKEDGPSGHIRNCLFRNVSVFAEEGVPPPQIKVMSLAPQNGAARPFEGVVFERFFMNGMPAEWSSFSFTTNTPVVLR